MTLEVTDGEGRSTSATATVSVGSAEPTSADAGWPIGTMEWVFLAALGGAVLAGISIATLWLRRRGPEWPSGTVSDYDPRDYRIPLHSDAPPVGVDRGGRKSPNPEAGPGEPAEDQLGDLV